MNVSAAIRARDDRYIKTCMMVWMQRRWVRRAPAPRLQSAFPVRTLILLHALSPKFDQILVLKTTHWTLVLRFHISPDFTWIIIYITNNYYHNYNLIPAIGHFSQIHL